MSYSPFDYKDLFPYGVFEYNSKPIKTWADSHRLFALNMRPFKNQSIKIADGLVAKMGHIKQKGGFSNYMIFEIDPKVRKVKLEFFQDKMLYPIDAFNKLNKPYLLTNAGYFYLTDDEKKHSVPPPKVRTGNMVISGGSLINLPVLDRGSIVVYKNGQVDILFLRAKGKVEIDGRRFEWIGSKSISSKKEGVVVYNSSNIEIEVVNDPVMGPSRRSKKVYIKPKQGKSFCICQKKGKAFVVIDVVQAKTVINDKETVLEISNKIKVKKGSNVHFLSVDSLNLKDVDSAISTGPLLFKTFKETEKQVEKEFSVSDMANPVNPHEADKKLARGCLIKLKGGKLVSVLVDGIPQAGKIYQGVNLREFVAFIKLCYPSFESALATDPSSSMKGVYRQGNKVNIFGNLHYLAHKRDKEGNIKFWPNGQKGRKLNSVLVIY